MAARSRSKLVLAVFLAAPACAQILGVQEVGDGPGGAGTTSSASSSGSSSSSSSTGSSSSSSTGSSSSSSGSKPCADAGADCAKCVGCMEKGACKTEYTSCAGAYDCSGFLDCEVNDCTQDSTFASCAVNADGGGCAMSTDTDPGYATLKDCVCAGCAAQCPELCN